MKRGSPRSIVFTLALFAVVTVPRAAHAQRAWHAVVGVGPFLTRDARGWNYENNVSASAGLTLALPADFALRAVGVLRMSKSPDTFAYPASVDPSLSRAGSVRQGVGAGVHLMSPSAWLGLYAVGGADYFRSNQSLIDDTESVAASGGIGIAWGAGRRWSVESRYARYARRLSATRGHLDVTLLRAF